MLSFSSCPLNLKPGLDPFNYDLSCQNLLKLSFASPLHTHFSSLLNSLPKKISSEYPLNLLCCHLHSHLVNLLRISYHLWSDLAWHIFAFEVNKGIVSTCYNTHSMSNRLQMKLEMIFVSVSSIRERLSLGSVRLLLPHIARSSLSAEYLLSLRIVVLTH